MTSNGINTQATYTCFSGYTLYGMSLITCRSDGSWDFTAPTCLTCPDLSDPESGTLTVTTTGSVTTATFSCQTGYYLSGESTLTCGSDVAWSSDVPTCKCNFPAQPSNGDVSVSGTGSVATYSCDTGYSLNGLSARTCQTDGSGWENTDPTCYECQTVTNPASGLFSLSSNGTHTSVRYTCNVGTTLNGVNVQVCMNDGLWEAAPPICVCQPPNAIINGNYDLLDHGMLAYYSCDPSYRLVGPQQRLCLSDGTGWNGTEPRCDLIIITTPRAGKSQEQTVLPIPTAAFVVICVIVFIILVVSIVGSICWYLRYKKVSQRVGTVFDSSDNRTTSTLDEARFNYESTDIEVGNLLIAKSLEQTKPFCNAKSLTRKTSRSSLETNKTEEEIRSKQTSSQTKIDLNHNGGILTAENGAVTETAM
ncbi:sushi, von Willebrand factor type A, EGF and pentraxin domain-containing protein 1-like [Ruditapes philippinarum]|uniref:sushi, von Willebrand factor type A, EGF and pentraxin domain-containing protein 1-like n=1 Tax=Ruditapes philippinarum TaxID=129788 RepID=UPI00295B6556|nr:sushi, von Willebrand factor type A, EGF and pentraxin domain-containing protein 1-like [Ruditapes philippinarum]